MEYIQIEGMTTCNSWGVYCSDSETCFASITVNDEIYEDECEEIEAQFNAVVIEEDCENDEGDCMDVVVIEGMTACYSYESECGDEWSCWAEITVDGESYEGDCEAITA